MKAYTTYFEDYGLLFLSLEPVLEILAELGLAIAQMYPNLLRYFLTLSVTARE